MMIAPFSHRASVQQVVGEQGDGHVLRQASFDHLMRAHELVRQRAVDGIVRNIRASAAIFGNSATIKEP